MELENISSKLLDISSESMVPFMCDSCVNNEMFWCESKNICISIAQNCNDVCSESCVSSQVGCISSSEWITLGIWTGVVSLFILLVSMIICTIFYCIWRKRNRLTVPPIYIEKINIVPSNHRPNYSINENNVHTL